MDKRWKKNGSRPKTKMTGQTTDNFLNWNRINFVLFVSVARNLSLYVIKRSMLVGANIAVKRLRTKSWCLLGYALGAKCLKVFFPYLCFLLQISSNFSILFVSSKGQRFCLTFPFEIFKEICARPARIDPHVHAQRLTAVLLEPTFDSSCVLFEIEISFKSERNQRPIWIPPFFFTRCSFLVHIFIYFAENYSNANLRETFSLSKFLHEESNCIDLSQKGEWFLED